MDEKTSKLFGFRLFLFWDIFLYHAKLNNFAVYLFIKPLGKKDGIEIFDFGLYFNFFSLLI